MHNTKSMHASTCTHNPPARTSATHARPPAPQTNAHSLTHTHNTSTATTTHTSTRPTPHTTNLWHNPWRATCEHDGARGCPRTRLGAASACRQATQGQQQLVAGLWEGWVLIGQAWNSRGAGRHAVWQRSTAGQSDRSCCCFLGSPSIITQLLANLYQLHLLLPSVASC